MVHIVLAASECCVYKRDVYVRCLLLRLGVVSIAKERKLNTTLEIDKNSFLSSLHSNQSILIEHITKRLSGNAFDAITMGATIQ